MAGGIQPGRRAGAFIVSPSLLRQPESAPGVTSFLNDVRLSAHFNFTLPAGRNHGDLILTGDISIAAHLVGQGSGWGYCQAHIDWARPFATRRESGTSND